MPRSQKTQKSRWKRLWWEVTNAFTIADAVHKDIMEMEGQEIAEAKECREDLLDTRGGTIGDDEDSNLTYVDQLVQGGCIPWSVT